ncbi:MAG: aromatic ring-hydroxylating dioxygenase subunit alpha, partial [Alphaproteobacteria bacterium]
IDPAHASFLHRFFQDEEPDEGYGRQFGDATTDIPVTRLLREFSRPEIRVEEMGYGLRILALRDLGNRGRHVRVTNLAFPNAIVIPMSAEMTISQWHVPIDDTRCYWYAIFTAFETKVDKDRMRAQRLELYRLPDYRAVRNRDNHWGFDPAEQRSGTYTGMGMDINVHDNWAIESPGPIFDRTSEHLGSTDKAIIANRRLLSGAIDAVGRGDPAPMMPATTQGPLAVDTLCPPDGWEAAWRAWERDRRRRSPWAA